MSPSSPVQTSVCAGDRATANARRRNTPRPRRARVVSPRRRPCRRVFPESASRSSRDRGLPGVVLPPHERENRIDRHRLRRPGSSPRRPTRRRPAGPVLSRFSFAVFCLHGERRLDRVADVDRLHEAQPSRGHSWRAPGPAPDRRTAPPRPRARSSRARRAARRANRARRCRPCARRRSRR